MLLLFPFLLLVALAGCDPNLSAPSTEEIRVTDALGSGSSEGYARATRARPFRFPADHGPHPAYRNEWWYITGNLEAPGGRRFGFQVTFFRIALQPLIIESPSAWRSNQIWMAHAALSDLQRQEHIAYERFARQGIGLAGAEADPVRVWLEDWHLEQSAEDGQWNLRLSTEGFALDLALEPLGPVVAQGDRGLSQKSAEPGNASHYYSIPRMGVSGQVTRAEQEIPVSGLAWFDREWSTSALGPDQAGWDWFSLQLQDGRNLMFYRLRTKAGGEDPHSSGSLSDASGLLKVLGQKDLALTPLRYWESGGRRYPIEWRLELEGEPAPWRVTAVMSDQEMRLSVRYWEGAVDVVEEGSGRLLGKGFLELAGYR